MQDLNETLIKSTNFLNIWNFFVYIVDGTILNHKGLICDKQQERNSLIKEFTLI